MDRVLKRGSDGSWVVTLSDSPSQNSDSYSKRKSKNPEYRRLTSQEIESLQQSKREIGSIYRQIKAREAASQVDRPA